MLSGADFYLNSFDPSLMGRGLHLFLLLVLLVLKLAEIHNLGNRRIRIWGDFNKVKPPFSGQSQCFFKRKHPPVFPNAVYNTQFLGVDLSVYSNFLGQVFEYFEA